MPGLVPGIPLRWAQCVPKRDGRDKPGHDSECGARTNFREFPRSGDTPKSPTISAQFEFPGFPRFPRRGASQEGRRAMAAVNAIQCARLQKYFPDTNQQYDFRRPPGHELLIRRDESGPSVTKDSRRPALFQLNAWAQRFAPKRTLRLLVSTHGSFRAFTFCSARCPGRLCCPVLLRRDSLAQACHP